MAWKLPELTEIPRANVKLVKTRPDKGTEYSSSLETSVFIGTKLIFLDTHEFFSNFLNYIYFPLF